MTGNPQLAAAVAEATAPNVGRKPGVVSREARSLARDLLDAPIVVRRGYLSTLKAAEMRYVMGEVLRETGSLWGLWQDDPAGFVEDCIGETMWGLQRRIAASMARPGIQRVAVPAGFGVGKTTLAGRLTAWAGAVYPVGSMSVVTTATRMRQVRSQMWPHIKTAVAKAKLPGRTDTVQWVAPDMYGNDVQVAYGFSAAPNDEAAMQGIHGKPYLMLIVDEAGGIAPLIGNGTNNLLTGDARLLATGNPAMDDPGSWFERLCAEGESEEESSTITIPIAAIDSPAITGEPTPICRLCVPNLDGHTIAEGTNGKSHLPDWTWLMRTLRDYGATMERSLTLEQVRALRNEQGLHPYIVAKVFAGFPKGGNSRIIPAGWVELAGEVDEPEGSGYVALNELGLDDEREKHLVKKGAWVRLGVDVAADGGDEFTIYRAVGDLVTEEHVSSGQMNADSMAVSEKVLEHILKAERLARALGSKSSVRVKIDTIGVGWGVVGHLERLGKVGRHRSKIVPVHVGEGIDKRRVKESAEMRPWRKRDEMWLAGRELLQPDPTTGEGRLRLRVPRKALTQLSTPNIGFNATGFVVVETKKSMRQRGVHSPDRAEGLLLSIYEPVPVDRGNRKGLIVG